MTGTSSRAEYSRWQIIAGCLLLQTINYYNVHQRLTAGRRVRMSYFHADALDKLFLGGFSSNTFTHDNTPPPPFEELHIKGELRGIQSVLLDLVVPECPIKHHHSWFPSPLYLFIYIYFRLVIPLWFTTFPTTQTTELLFYFSYFMVPLVGCRLLLRAHSQGVFCLLPASCSRMLGDLISRMYDDANLEPGAC